MRNIAKAMQYRHMAIVILHLTPQYCLLLCRYACELPHTALHG
jgi:hypothetical protein